MKVEELFKEDIFRQINGVVKADQLDDASVWQELKEFIVTQELGGHLDKFFEAYSEALRDDTDSSGKIGVWISGFFGSGKSHFLKVLSYILANKTHTFKGEQKNAVDFFKEKIKDSIVFGDIQRAVASNTDVILFNIDSKAERGAGRDAILAVFLKVLNQMQGFSGDHAHVAHMERHLREKGKLQAFHEAYRAHAGGEWHDERDAYEFNRDEVVQALSEALGQSTESCEKWVDGGEDNFSLTVENFAKWTRAYLDAKQLDSQGEKHRIIFLVDEVGQFIGSDPHLMLNLQTIVEELGTVCQGRAWVVVTSQEDIDAALGEIGASKSNDFSKIQGRFKTRLSLSSRNVDEVIQKRLLAKNEEATTALEALWHEKSDIIRHQLTFKNVGMTFKRVKNADDFVANYPFVPYQFQLLQKIFESIRKVGATGLHLAQGERSLLDAFQLAGQNVAVEPLGVSIPLYEFYPSIEGFLDTSVKRAIENSRDNDALEEFDAHVLEVLFLIRYVDEVRGNIDNLVTLCLDQIDADKLALRERIQASLRRLEGETLISRSGDNFYFLTNEERDISREIKSEEVPSSEEARLLGELIFDEIFAGQRKHRYEANKMDFSFNRVCDTHPIGRRVDGGLLVSVITPVLGEEYKAFDDKRCTLASSFEDGQVIIRLEEEESLGRELRAYLQTDKYTRTRNDGTLPASTERVHRGLAEDNRQRRERLKITLTEMITEARYYVAGNRPEINTAQPITALREALDYLIDNTFNKMGWLKTLHDEPRKEIQQILRSDDVAQLLLDVPHPKSNSQAIEDLRHYIDLCTQTSKQIVLYELIYSRYAVRPYGWPNLEVILLLARLYMNGEIRFTLNGASVERERVYDNITTPSKWRKIVVLQRATTQPEEIRKARQLGNQVFEEMGPDGEDPLYTFLREKVQSRKEQLAQYKPMAETGKYPGQEEIGEGLAVLKALLAANESNIFLKRFNERRNDLLDLADTFRDIEHFYEHQRRTWDRLRAAVERFDLNRLELNRHDEARTALVRMREILEAPHPFGMIHETEHLINTVQEVNFALLEEGRKRAAQALNAEIQQVDQELKRVEADDSWRMICLQPLESLQQRVQKEPSLAHLTQVENEAVRFKDDALAKLDKFIAEKATTQKNAEAPPPAVKPRYILKVSDLVQKTYLESPEDVQEFLDALQKMLDGAMERGERIEIR